MLINLVCLIPLLERFEAEHGTLNTTAMFLGREWDGITLRKRRADGGIAFGSLPAALYILVDMVIFRDNTPVLGSR